MKVNNCKWVFTNLQNPNFDKIIRSTSKHSSNVPFSFEHLINEMFYSLVTYSIWNWDDIYNHGGGVTNSDPHLNWLRWWWRCRSVWIENANEMRIKKLYLHVLLGVIEIIAMIFFYASNILANNRHRTIPGYIVQCT